MKKMVGWHVVRCSTKQTKNTHLWTNQHTNEQTHETNKQTGEKTHNKQTNKTTSTNKQNKIKETEQKRNITIEKMIDRKNIERK